MAPVGPPVAVGRWKTLLLVWISAGSRVLSFPEPEEVHRSLFPDLRSYVCTNPAEVWTTGDLVLLCAEDGAGWTNSLERCVEDVRGIGIAQCSESPPRPSYTYIQREYTQSSNVFARYYVCYSGYHWLSDERGHLTQCLGGEWTPILDRCEADNTPDRPHCPGAAPEPAHSTVVKQYANPGDGYVFLKYLNCSTGMTWFTGPQVIEVECVNGNWPEVFDICVEDCPRPRHCADLAELGITNSGTYSLFYGRDRISVECELSSNMADSGWSVILRNYRNGYMAGNYPAFERGIMLTSGGASFIGFAKLLWMNRGENGIEPLVFRFTFKNGETLYHATYDNVVIGDRSSTYQLRETGNYHGDAGDAFSASIGQTVSAFGYQNIAGNAYWWKDYNGGYKILLTGAAIFWYACTDCVTLAEVTLAVRPKYFDEKYACQSSNLTRRDLPYTSVNVPLSRAPGVMVTFTCTDGLRREGVEGGRRRPSGAIKCVSDLEGHWVWNDTVALPCFMWCPDDFVSPEDGKCFHFSRDEAEFGLAEASLKCAAKNSSSLAKFQSLADLRGAETDVFYYTQYTTDGSTMFPESIPSDFACDSTFEQCQRDEMTTECLLVANSTNTSSYHVQDCYESARYACMLPATCPPGYALHKGLCYKDLDLTGNIRDGLLECNEIGAGLAYPEDIGTLTKIVQLFGSGSSAHLVTGIHEREGNWTAEFYSPKKDLVTYLNVSHLDGESWRQINGTSMSVFALGSEDVETFRFVCQYGGPIGCRDEPPPLAGNMTLDWDHRNVFGVMIFDCYPGYFVNGSVPETQQSKNCYGQLGGWFPEGDLLDCYAKEVCFEDPVAPSVLMTNYTEPTHRYINGSVTFFCPVTMVTPSLRPTQTFNCSTDGSSFYFYPLEVEDCNVCTGEPLVENGTTDWSAQVNYSVGQSVRATCNESYLCSVYSDVQDIECSPVGWMNATPCYEACVDPPPAAGVNMAMENLTWNGIGAVLRYRCDEGHYIPPNISFPEVLDSTVAVCGTDRKWSTEWPLYCTVLCWDDPLPPPEYSNYTWDNFTRTEGYTVNYTCEEERLFGNLQRTLPLACENDGKWSFVSRNDFACRIPMPIPPPPAPFGATLEQQPPYWVGSIANYTCPDGKMSPRGDTCTSVVANETGWSVLDPEFGCYNACQAPPAVPLHAWANESEAWIWGTEVTYICPGEFEGGGFNYTTVCVDGNWTLFELPYCKGISRRLAFGPIPRRQILQRPAFGSIPRRRHKLTS